MLRTEILAMLLATCVLFASNGVSGHHSYAAAYDRDRLIEIRGEVAVFMYRNPHSVLQVLVKRADGEVVRWACEWGGTGALHRGGVSRETLKPGDTVIVTGNPGRNAGVPRLLVRSIHRPADGWSWSGESSE